MKPLASSKTVYSSHNDWKNRLFNIDEKKANPKGLAFYC